MATKRFVSKDNLGRVWTRLFGKVLNSKEEIEANTSENMIAGADAVKEVYSSLQDSSSGESFNFGSLNGVRGFFTDPSKADDSFVPFKSFKRFYAANIYAHTTETEYKVGFKPRFFMLGYTGKNAVFWYDETLNKTFYNGCINVQTNIGSWIIPDGVNALCCITEINDTGFKAICNSNCAAFVIAFG